MLVAQAPQGSGLPMLIAQEYPDGRVVVQEVPVHIPWEVRAWRAKALEGRAAFDRMWLVKQPIDR